MNPQDSQLTAGRWESEEYSAFGSGEVDVRFGNLASDLFLHVVRSVGHRMVADGPPRFVVGPRFADQEFRVFAEKVRAEGLSRRRWEGRGGSAGSVGLPGVGQFRG